MIKSDYLHSGTRLKFFVQGLAISADLAADMLNCELLLIVIRLLWCKQIFIRTLTEAIALV